jgi:hypothetical protein
MGSAVIRAHSINGQDFQPDGWFGYRQNDDEQVMPDADPTLIDLFKNTFGLTRKHELGLSVVVPYVDERLGMDDLRRGIVRNFFWPILLGELIVEMEGPGGPWRLDAESLPTHRSLLPAPEAAVVEFALWASTAKPAEIVVLDQAVATRPDWRTIGAALLTGVKLGEIRALLESNQKVGVTIPVRVRPRVRGNEEPKRDSMSSFTLFIASCRDTGHRPIFLRDGIVIKDVRAPQLQGSRSLVVVEQPALAGLLGDSEGVNHTQWQKDSPKFHNRYVYGPDTIKFVTRSVFEVMQALHAGETQGDPTLLLDLFFLPANDGKVEPQTSPKTDMPPGTAPPVPPSPPPASPKRFDLRRVDGGFIIKPGILPAESLPLRIRIQAAYATRRGNPIKRWGADDFVFTRQPLRQEPKPNGVNVIREDGNSIEIEIKKPDFQFGICGFDKKRDLVVRAIEMRDVNEENL